MKKPDTDHITQLILEAPLGLYIGEEGARVLAECACCEKKLKDGEYLFHQGDTDNSFYIVTAGRLALVKELKKGSPPRILHVLEKGDLVGELSFIDNTPHTASVMALGDAAVICFRAEDFKPLITRHPELMYDFMRAVIKRVHQTLADIGKQQLALADYITTAGKGKL